MTYPHQCPRSPPRSWHESLTPSPQHHHHEEAHHRHPTSRIIQTSQRAQNQTRLKTNNVHVPPRRAQDEKGLNLSRLTYHESHPLHHQPHPTSGANRSRPAGIKLAVWAATQLPSDIYLGSCRRSNFEFCWSPGRRYSTKYICCFSISCPA